MSKSEPKKNEKGRELKVDLGESEFDCLKFNIAAGGCCVSNVTLVTSI